MDDAKVQAMPPLSELRAQEPEEKAVRDLTRGTWIQLIDDEGDDLGEAEVLAVETYRTKAHREFSALFYRPRDGRPYSVDLPADITVPLLSAERLAEAKAAAERAGRIADIRAYADWLETNPSVQIDPPDAQVNLYGPDAVDQVRAFAATFGVPVRESLTDRTSARFAVGSVEHRVIAWHNDGRPAEPQQVAHPSWPTEQELKPWESLAPEADRVAESVKPIDPHFEGVGEPGPDPDTQPGH